MTMVVLKNPARSAEIQTAKKDYDNYIKITVDIEKEIVVIGGEYHADAERLLLKDYQSRQADIWAGGLDLITGFFECNAIVNLRPGRNDSTEILNPKIRKKFLLICQKFLGKYGR